MDRQRVFIFDTTLRDGEQVPGCKLNHRQKLIVAKKLEELGIDVLEAGFPISSPGDFKAVEMISKEIVTPVICGLSRAVEKDIEIAAEALRMARRPRIHTGIGTSPQHIYYKLKSDPEKLLNVPRQQSGMQKSLLKMWNFMLKMPAGQIIFTWQE